MIHTDPTVGLVRTDDSRFDRLLNEIGERIQSGDEIDVEQYVQQSPEYADRLRKAIPGIRALVNLGHDKVLGNDTPESALGELGDFRIIREIGRGGMGVVYEAEQISLGRTVALKVLPFATMLDERQLQRFKNEARAAATLDHPHIVSVFGIGQHRGVHYYAMHLIEGMSLAEVVAELRAESPESRADEDPVSRDAKVADPPRRAERVPRQQRHSDSPFPIPHSPFNSTAAALSTVRSKNPRDYFQRVAELGIQAAQGLDHAHERGILHRDIKPANLMLDAAGKLYITDFGLARIETDAGMTMTGDLLGTLRYMSPEQALAKRVVVDHRSDIYSLGVTLYELVTHKHAFAGADRHELLKQIAFEEPTAPRKLNRSIPPELETIILKSIEKNPGDRYTTAADLADDLRRFTADEAIHAKPPGAVLRLTKWSRRNRTLVASLVATIAVLGCSAVVSAVLLLQAYQRESAQRTAAETAHARAQRNLQVARNIVDQVYLQQAAELEEQGVQTASQRAFLKQAASFYESLPTEELDDPEVRQEAAEAILSLGRIRGALGQPEQAVAAYRKSIEIVRPLLSDDSRHDAAIIAARAHHNLGWRLLYVKEFEEAIGEFRESVQLRDELIMQLDKNEVLLVDGLDIASASLGGALVDAGQTHSNETLVEEGLQLLTESIAESRQLTDAHRDDVRPYKTMATVLGYRAVALSRLERYDEAAEIYRQAIQACQDGLANHPNHRLLRWRRAAAEMDLGRVLVDEQHEQEQLQHSQRAIELMRELVEDYADRPFYRYELIGMLRNAALYRNRRGFRDQATQFFRLAVQETQAWMAEVDESQAQQIACQAVLGVNLNSLGIRYIEASNYKQAAECFLQACEYDLACPKLRAESRMPAQSLVLVQCIVRTPAEITIEDFLQALHCIERSLKSHNSAEGRYLHGVALLRVGRVAEALSRLEAIDHPKTRFFRAIAYHQLGQIEQARTANQEAAAWLKENLAEEKYYGNVRDEVITLLEGESADTRIQIDAT